MGRLYPNTAFSRADASCPPMRRLRCWFRGHTWRYDGHVWGSATPAHDLFVCADCGLNRAEPSVVDVDRRAERGERPEELGVGVA